MTHARGVAITGMGVVTPVGTTPQSAFRAVTAGQRSTTSDLIAPVVGFCPDETIPRRDARRMDRNTQFAVVAAEQALACARLDATAVDAARVAVVIGSGVGGIATLEGAVEARVVDGPARVGPLVVPMMMTNAAAGTVAMRHGFTGPAFSIATACASGANSIGEAAAMVRSGRVDVAVAGGTEACITPTALAGFARMGAMSSRSADPSGASRPFDRERDGFVMGEGAGIVVLEDVDHARARGAQVLGLVAGYGATCDAHHLTAPDPSATAAIACMRSALADAEISPVDVGHINAHGTSTPMNDEIEARAICEVFGAEGPPVTSTKGSTGHLIGAAGAVEAILGIMAAAAGLVPPVANLADPDVDARVDLVIGEARAISRPVVVSNSFGFGGHNACLVLVAGDDHRP